MYKSINIPSQTRPGFKLLDIGQYLQQNDVIIQDNKIIPVPLELIGRLLDSTKLIGSVWRVTKDL